MIVNPSHDSLYQKILKEIDDCIAYADNVLAELENEFSQLDWDLIERTSERATFENTFGEQRIISASYINKIFDKD